jgi:RimJ/RimL family protein N-acetyltransferase
MEIVETRDRSLLESFFRRNVSWHLYALADLDDPFWKDTRWICAVEAGEIRGVILLLTPLSTPILYGICEPNDPATRFLLRQITDQLPGRFFAHVGLGVLDVLERAHFAKEGEFFKMQLIKATMPKNRHQFATERESDYEILKKFYDHRAYGDDKEQRFFEPYMVEMSHYNVIREGGEIISAAGVHVASTKYRVAALGNIATSPQHRGKGYATMVTGNLCADLLARYDNVGLNVRSDNEAAIRCYEGLGFQRNLRYEEGIVTVQTAEGY